jgi:phosphoribosylamine--glycine ligase
LRVLVVGSGGREHALCWAISSSPLCDALFCAPGNPGIADEAACVDVQVGDTDGILKLCKKEKIDFVVIGPEGPLVAGLVDRLEAAGIAAFGPSAAAAALEGSKGFTKDLCAKYHIPTAGYRRFTDAAAAKDYVKKRKGPIVVKADGLAAGKGVTIAKTVRQATAAIDAAMVAQKFGQAGAEVVIEDFLEGEEVSFFALVDGKRALGFGSAQDHKRAGDGDTGPNTGGMGAYSPAPVLTPELEVTVMETIILPTVHAMAKEGRPYKGVLYAGLMLTKSGPQLIEYNARFGDPECQVLLPRLKSDLLARRGCALRRAGGQGLSQRHRQGLGNPRPRRRGGERHLGQDLPRRDKARRRETGRRRRPRAQRSGARPFRARGAEARLCRGG